MADEGDSKRPALRVVPGAGGRANGSEQRGEAAPPHGGETSRIRPVDESLLAAFLVGDDDAFGELFRRNEPLVLAIVRRYARNPEDARDLAQRTFLRAPSRPRGARSGGGATASPSGAGSSPSR